VTMPGGSRKPLLAHCNVSDNLREDERKQQRTYESSQE
jgi:hypothetical protein